VRAIPKRRPTNTAELSLLAIALLIALFLLLRAHTVATGQPSNKTQVQQQQTSETLLRAQLDLTREYDQRLLATVYWSLSATFLLLVLVGGINWWTNFRLYEREREALRELIQVNVQQESAKLEDGFRKLHESVDCKLSTQRSELQSAVTSATKDALQKLSGNMLQIEYEHTKFKAQFHAEGTLWTRSGTGLNISRYLSGWAGQMSTFLVRPWTE